MNLLWGTISQQILPLGRACTKYFCINRIYKKILDCNWLSAHLLGTWPMITSGQLRVSGYNFL